MRVQLTKRQVETYQPQERPYEVRDAQVRGLNLRVQPSGHKTMSASFDQRPLGMPESSLRTGDKLEKSPQLRTRLICNNIWTAAPGNVHR
jgi:hypothetical protein